MKQFTKASLRSLMALAFVCGVRAGRGARGRARPARHLGARGRRQPRHGRRKGAARGVGSTGLALSTADELKSGDTVRTGPTGRVEILLNPGSYFRAGGDTEFTLASATSTNCVWNSARGSAVVEATGDRLRRHGPLD